jgi:hypothetical protein
MVLNRCLDPVHLGSFWLTLSEMARFQPIARKQIVIAESRDVRCWKLADYLVKILQLPHYLNAVLFDTDYCLDLLVKGCSRIKIVFMAHLEAFHFINLELMHFLNVSIRLIRPLDNDLVVFVIEFLYELDRAVLLFLKPYIQVFLDYFKWFADFSLNLGFQRLIIGQVFLHHAILGLSLITL